MVEHTIPETPENMRYSYLDKFQVLDGPMQLPPHKCAGCGYALVSNTDKYVDWCFDVEFYGQVALCLNCFRSAANQIGYMGPDQWESVMVERSDLYGKLDEVIQENMRLRDALASLGLIGLPVDSVNVAADGEDQGAPESDGGAFEESGVSDEDAGESDDSEQESDGQDSGSGSTVVSGDDALEQLIADTI